MDDRHYSDEENGCDIRPNPRNSVYNYPAAGNGCSVGCVVAALWTAAITAGAAGGI